MNSKHHSSAVLVLLVTLCVGASYALAQSPDPKVVISQSLAAIKSSSRIAAVLWTRRADHYTLQVVFPRSSSVCMRPDTAVTVWLLGPDGATIPVSRDAASSCSEDLYSVPISSGQSAAAVALKIDDEYFIEKLKQLN